MSFTFTKQERLKSRKIISGLFLNGKVIGNFPVKVFWTTLPDDVNAVTQYGFSAPKKKFKRAVDRNRIKRLMREAVRLHKGDFERYMGTDSPKMALMFLYTGNELPKYHQVEEKIVACFNKLKQLKNEIS